MWPDVFQGLREAGIVCRSCHLSVVDVKGTLEAVVATIRRHGRTGQPLAGGIYVYDIAAAWPIEGGQDGTHSTGGGHS